MNGWQIAVIAWWAFSFGVVTYKLDILRQDILALRVAGRIVFILLIISSWGWLN